MWNEYNENARLIAELALGSSDFLVWRLFPKPLLKRIPKIREKNGRAAPCLPRSFENYLIVVGSRY